MRLYSEVLFPWACDWLMSTAAHAALRQRFLSGVRGEVLEIGFGTGLNLAHYPPTVEKLTIVEPNPGMNRRAARRLRESPIAVETHSLAGEALPFANEAFDSVTCSWTLCSVSDPLVVLGEIRRVLRREGRFHFVEHGLSPHPGVARWQRRLNPLERRLGDGCQLTLDVPDAIRRSGLSSLALAQFYQRRVPWTHGYLYLGLAARSGATP